MLLQSTFDRKPHCMPHVLINRKWQRIYSIPYPCLMYTRCVFLVLCTLCDSASTSDLVDVVDHISQHYMSGIACNWKPKVRPQNKRQFVSELSPWSHRCSLFSREVPRRAFGSERGPCTEVWEADIIPCRAQDTMANVSNGHARTRTVIRVSIKLYRVCVCIIIFRVLWVSLPVSKRGGREGKCLLSLIEVDPVPKHACPSH